MRKYILNIIVIVISLISISSYSNAASKTTIELVSSTNSIVKGNNITVKVNIKDQKMGVSAIDCFINYDNAIFEDLTKDDITTTIPKDKIDTFVYNNDTKKLMITLSESIENLETIFNINFKVRDSIDENSSSSIYLSHINLYNCDNDNYLMEEENSEEIKFDKEEDKELYLSSNKYKIGENNTNIYESGDEYITRISPETSIEEFLNNLDTNATSKIICNADNTEQNDLSELVKTGMTIKLSKQGYQDINLTLVVIGDIDGNGKVTATDLAAINQHILKDIELQNAQFVAADISDDKNITATDLAAMIQIILKEIVL